MITASSSITNPSEQDCARALLQMKSSVCPLMQNIETIASLLPSNDLYSLSTTSPRNRPMQQHMCYLARWNSDVKWNLVQGNLRGLRSVRILETPLDTTDMFLLLTYLNRPHLHELSLSFGENFDVSSIESVIKLLTDMPNLSSLALGFGRGSGVLRKTLFTYLQSSPPQGLRELRVEARHVEDRDTSLCDFIGTLTTLEHLDLSSYEAESPYCLYMALSKKLHRKCLGLTHLSLHLFPLDNRGIESLLIDLSHRHHLTHLTIAGEFQWNMPAACYLLRGIYCHRHSLTHLSIRTDKEVTHANGLDILVTHLRQLKTLQLSKVKCYADVDIVKSLDIALTMTCHRLDKVILADRTTGLLDVGWRRCAKLVLIEERASCP